MHPPWVVVQLAEVHNALVGNIGRDAVLGQAAGQQTQHRVLQFTAKPRCCQ